MSKGILPFVYTNAVGETRKRALTRWNENSFYIRSCSEIDTLPRIFRKGGVQEHFKGADHPLFESFTTRAGLSSPKLVQAPLLRSPSLDYRRLTGQPLRQVRTKWSAVRINGRGTLLVFSDFIGRIL